MPTTDTPSEGIGINDAASQMEGFLTSQEAPETPDEENVVDDALADDAGALEAEADSEETILAEEEEVEEEDDAEAEAADTDEEDEEGDEEDTLYTVKIDGKEEKVSLDEALKGYQRQSDYTRKSQALAEQRKALEAEVSKTTEAMQAVSEERQQYAQLLTALSSQLEDQLQNEPDWDALHRENPLEFAYVRAQWEDAQKRQQAANSELERVGRQQAQDHEKMMRETVAVEQDKLLEALPEWKDPKRAEAERKKIREFGKEIGFTDEELSSTFDHRAVLALRMAMRFSEMKGNKPTANAKGSKVVRAGSSPGQTTSQSSKQKAARKRLEQTGSREAAASLFETLL